MIHACKTLTSDAHNQVALDAAKARGGSLQARIDTLADVEAQMMYAQQELTQARGECEKAKLLVVSTTQEADERIAQTELDAQKRIDQIQARAMAQDGELKEVRDKLVKKEKELINAVLVRTPHYLLNTSPCNHPTLQSANFENLSLNTKNRILRRKGMLRSVPARRPKMRLRPSERF